MKKYTAEQIGGEVADMSAEGYPDGLRTNMLRAFAATLRQQGEQAGGVVLEEAVADGMQPSRPKPHMPVNPLDMEDFCFCDNHVSLQSISGGLAPEGYLGSVRLNIDGEFVSYIRADLHAERARVPDVVDAFDKAVADELPRVSHVQFDSHEICEHFAGEVRKRLLAAPSQPEDAGHE